MKTDLSHLPGDKRDELKIITDVIRKTVEPEMIILFGSHARGDWVEDRYVEGHVLYEYMSDYDILVIVEKPAQAAARHAHWNVMRRVLRRELGDETAVSTIAHDIEFVNARLGEGRYLFTDIKREGVMLHDSGRFTLAEPRELSAEEKSRMAREDFDEWFGSASNFYTLFETAVEKAMLKEAAFQLHQATERFYTSALLVHTGYRPKLHDIEVLGKRAAALDRRLAGAFPRSTPEEDKRFDLLKRAYVDARYKRDYAITREDLDYLAARVRELRSLVEESCRKRIAGLGGSE
ncbi:MAG: HEPN domain-containing protein [Planctomycetota bacterium]|jgi:predicted nucleotidyltransferase/HEPN domain-containing protein